MKEDGDLFKAEMQGVKPLKTEKHFIKKAKQLSDEEVARRRAIATASTQEDDNALAVDHLEMVEPLDELNFHKPGIQHGVLKNMRLGKYQIEAKLDLHHRTVEQARQDVYEFIRDCVKYDLRCVIITHGKGMRSEPKALLKSQVNRWLPEFEQVLAFHSCQPRHGGVGAVYVMLKKSDEKKLANRERFWRRGG